MKSIRRLMQRISGRPTPVPPGTGLRIQQREQAEARARLLDQVHRNAAEYRYERPAR